MNTATLARPHEAVHADVFFPVKYRFFRNDPVFRNNFNVGRSLDMSVEDLLLAVGKHNPVNSTLDLELELPNGSSAYVVGKVIEGVDRLANGISYHFDKIVFAKLDHDAEELITHEIFERIKKRAFKKA